MGLAIVATLLMNTDSQILVVCYTNHALDQFLMGIARHTDSIVRIGNQSKNEMLDRFNIKQLCENGITDKRVKTSLFKLRGAYAEAVQEFNDLQNQVAESKETDETYYKKYIQIQVCAIDLPKNFNISSYRATIFFHFASNRQDFRRSVGNKKK